MSWQCSKPPCRWSLLEATPSAGEADVKSLPKKKYGCLMLVLPDEIKKEIFAWTKANIPEECLTGDGYETDPHITLKHGFVDSGRGTIEALQDLFANIRPFPVNLAGISIFHNPEEHVLKLDVDSLFLHELNREVSARFPCEDKHPDYKPHLTLCYLKSEDSDEFLKKVPPFVGKDVLVDTLVFSSASKSKTYIKLSSSVKAMSWLGTGSGGDLVKPPEFSLAPRRRILVPQAKSILYRIKSLEAKEQELEERASLIADILWGAFGKKSAQGQKFLDSYCTKGVPDPPKIPKASTGSKGPNSPRTAEKPDIANGGIQPNQPFERGGRCYVLDSSQGQVIQATFDRCGIPYKDDEEKGGSISGNKPKNPTLPNNTLRNAPVQAKGGNPKKSKPMSFDEAKGEIDRVLNEGINDDNLNGLVDNLSKMTIKELRKVRDQYGADNASNKAAMVQKIRDRVSQNVATSDVEDIRDVLKQDLKAGKISKEEYQNNIAELDRMKQQEVSPKAAPKQEAKPQPKPEVKPQPKATASKKGTRPVKRHPDDEHPKYPPLSAEPDIPDGMVRFYHGGSATTGQRWVSPSRAYAIGYAEKNNSGDKKLWFVDIPKDSRILAENSEDLGSGKPTYGNFEVPAEIGNKLQEVKWAKGPEESKPEVKPQPQKPTPQPQKEEARKPKPLPQSTLRPNPQAQAKPEHSEKPLTGKDRIHDGFKKLAEARKNYDTEALRIGTQMSNLAGMVRERRISRTEAEVVMRRLGAQLDAIDTRRKKEEVSKAHAILREAMPGDSTLTPNLSSDLAGAEKNANEGAKFVSSLLNGSIKGKLEIQSLGEDGRAHFDPVSGDMYVSGNEQPHIFVHEMAHWMENNVPGAMEACLDFLDRRVGSEKPRKLSEFNPGYGDDLGRKDNFDKLWPDDPSRGYYVGLDAKDDAGRHTELLSMGMELLYQDPVHFSQTDPEYFDFILGILSGESRKGSRTGKNNYEDFAKQNGTTLERLAEIRRANKNRKKQNKTSSEGGKLRRSYA